MPLRDNLLAPIPGSNPSGVDLRYDPIVDKIKEARREELEAPQGAWKTAVKIADYAQVVQLAGEVLANRSKNLQLAVWLVDAHVRREGFGMLPACLRFLRALCDEFWDTLYPEIEEDDLEMRAAPLEWLGSKLDQPIRLLPITASGLNWFQYKESRAVGYEAQADTNEKRKAREQAIEDGKLSAEEFDQAVGETPKTFCEKQLAFIEEAQTALEEFIPFLDDRFGSVSPSFLPVRSALQDNAQAVRSFIAQKGGATPAQVSPQPAAPVAATLASEVPATLSAPVVAAAPAQPPVARPFVQSGPDPLAEPVDLDDAAKRLAVVARYLRTRDVYDSAPYLILRGFRWGEIRYNGPEIDRNMLTPPESELRAELARIFQAGQWDKVLALTEQAMETPCGRAWLDLQRYAVKALEAKGEWFAFVADAVRSSLRALLHDLPALLETELRDGSPIADTETAEWIQTQVLDGSPLRAPVRFSRAPEPAAPPPPPIDSTAKPVEIEAASLSDAVVSSVFDEAVAAVQAGDMPRALGLLHRELTLERSGRGRFRRRVQLAHLLMLSGRERIAQPVLEELAEEIQHRKLEEWEDREALAYPLSLLLRCADADPEKRQRLYAAVCRLDPVRALELPV